MIRTHKLFSHALPVLVAALVCAAFAAAPAGAQTFTVDTSATTGGDCTATPTSCTIVQAINSANAISDSDTIKFDGDRSITIDAPLPTVTAPLTIDGAGDDIEITGSATYVTDVCASGDPAIGRTVPGVLTISAIAVNNVCGNAFGAASAPSPPTLQVGPRRADGTVAIGGSAAPGAIQLYRADAPASGREASSFYQGFFTAADGSFGYVPAVTPSAGQKFSATVGTAGGTSNYSAIATTPQDLTSPSLNTAVAINNNTVRLDFNEAIAGNSSPASAFSLGMSNNLRPIAGVTVSGNSVYLASSLPWNTGEAGVVGITGVGRVTDPTGNELLGTPTATVFAGPGEISIPTVSSYRAKPSRYCQKVTKSCRRGAAYLYLTTNKSARVIFNFYKGLGKKRFIVRLIKHLDAGRNKVKITGSINGKTLPASVMTVSVTVQDAARTWSVPVDTPIRVVKNKRDL